ncbi:MAG: hypothetical protein P8Y70_04820 [Candidatus Lokiarchaeota archaeon]
MKIFKKKLKKPHEAIRCPLCGGTGMVRKFYPDTALGWLGGKMNSSSAEEPCPKCDGVGWVEKI